MVNRPPEWYWSTSDLLPSAALALGPYWVLLVPGLLESGVQTRGEAWPGGCWVWLSGPSSDARLLRSPHPRALAPYWGRLPASAALDWLAGARTVSVGLWDHWHRLPPEGV